MGRFFAENAEFLRKMRFFFDFSCTVKIFALYLHSQSGNMVATFKNYCGNSSVGRAQPCQGWGREFESRFPLQEWKSQRNLRLFSLYIPHTKSWRESTLTRFLLYQLRIFRYLSWSRFFGEKGIFCNKSASIRASKWLWLQNDCTKSFNHLIYNYVQRYFYLS